MNSVLSSRVWYLAYGSNISPRRLGLYLDGAVAESGARNSTPPPRSCFVQVPLKLTFAKRSQRWNGGGVAFVTPTPAGDDTTAWVRAWDLTAEQFEDVWAQENRVKVGTEFPWPKVLGRTETIIGTGWYRRVLNLDVPELEQLAPGQPALTFTWSSPEASNPPNLEYRATIATGLNDNPGLDADAIRAYLDAATLA